MLAVVDACAHPEGCKDSYGAYVTGCRGEACRARSAEYARERRRAEARPDVVALPSRVPTGQVRAHLEELRAVGIGLPRVARLSGVSERTVLAIRSGQRKSTTPEVRDRLLAVMPSQVAPSALIDAGPTWERITELYEAGWTEPELAAEVHGPGRTRLRLNARRITAAHADVVRLLWREHAEEAPGTGDPLAEFRLLLSDLASADQAWRADAECRRLDGDSRARSMPFFPTRGDEVDTARAICEACPVVVECLDFALVTRSQGFWGNTTGGDRRTIRHLGLSAVEVAALRAEHPDVRLADLLARQATVDSHAYDASSVRDGVGSGTPGMPESAQVAVAR